LKSHSLNKRKIKTVATAFAFKQKWLSQYIDF